MIGEDVPDWCWKKNFCMSKECFLELADELHQFLFPNPDSPNCRALSKSSNNSLLSLWMTENAFGIHQCTASKHTFSVRGNQYNTGTKVLTSTKEH